MARRAAVEGSAGGGRAPRQGDCDGRAEAAAEADFGSGRHAAQALLRAVPRRRGRPRSVTFLRGCGRGGDGAGAGNG
eukprot:CAMPEP_0113722882 /NCGR_PEP_ID=MMETSP0038_2-20120614/38046_1 /TAXON_ID=2898 /ORGANISM="Cryptomonas paramecium" /LENGTH=76 /DNA_ID=CAMNT_0000652273 /DNA_START=369 /DNA_END=595 /DNA_ORIENTATION=- /assembly_acc=CAM_ASM_000170